MMSKAIILHYNNMSLENLSDSETIYYSSTFMSQLHNLVNEKQHFISSHELFNVSYLKAYSLYTSFYINMINGIDRN